MMGSLRGGEIEAMVLFNVVPATDNLQTYTSRKFVAMVKPRLGVLRSQSRGAQEGLWPARARNFFCLCARLQA